MTAKKQTLDDLIEQLAQKYLGIETLKEQGRDHLDFHEVGVAGLKKALEAAYNKGRVDLRAELEADWPRPR